MEAQCETALTIVKKSLQNKEANTAPKNRSEMNWPHCDSALN